MKENKANPELLGFAFVRSVLGVNIYYLTIGDNIIKLADSNGVFSMWRYWGDYEWTLFHRFKIDNQEELSFMINNSYLRVLRERV